MAMVEMFVFQMGEDESICKCMKGERQQCHLSNMDPLQKLFIILFTF